MLVVRVLLVPLPLAAAWQASSWRLLPVMGRNESRQMVVGFGAQALRYNRIDLVLVRSALVVVDSQLAWLYCVS